MSAFMLEAAPMDGVTQARRIALKGSIDAATAPQFEEQAMKQIADNGKRLFIDCKNLEFISSAGLGVFMVLLGEVEDGGFMRIYNLREEVFQPFELLGFTELLEIYKTEDEAKHAG